MGKITTAPGLGNVVPRPVLQSELQTPRGAFGGGAATEDAGATVSAMGDAAAREQKMQREAADRATASGKLLDAQDMLTQAHDEIAEGVANGKIDKTKATEEWQRRADEVRASVAEGVPATHAQDFGNGVKRATMKLGRALELTVQKRDQDDVKAGIGTTLEYAARLYASDPESARKIATDTLQQLGPFSGLGADQVAKMGQNWREAATYTSAYTGINAARNSNAALQAWEQKLAGPEFADLDPQKKATLLATSSSYQAANMQRAEAAAARAERQREAHLKRAEAEFNVVQGLSDKGGALDPAYIQGALQRTAGTPYQAGIAAAAQQAVATGGLALQPVSRQRAALADVDAQIAANGRSPELDKRRSQIERVATASETDIKRDGLHAYQERGGGPTEPIDLTTPVSLGTSILKRVAYSQQASAWAERPVSPLFDPEADKLRDMLSGLPPKARSEAVAAIARNLPAQQAAALARQMDPKDKALGLAFAYGVQGTSEGRFTSELLFKGAAAQKDGTSTKGSKEPEVKARQWRALLAEQLSGVFVSQAATDSALDGATLMAHGMAAEASGELSARNLTTAANLAVEGSIAELNGRKVALPAQTAIGALEARLRTITPEEIAKQAGSATVRAGGVDVPVADFTKHLPGAELQTVRPGQYIVLVNGRPVTGARGVPVLIGLK